MIRRPRRSSSTETLFPYTTLCRSREGGDGKAFGLLSRQRPVAGDLRTVVAALRMVAELERRGDLSVHIAKIARLRVPQRAVPEQSEPTIRKMAEIAEAMSGKVAEVIATRDVEAARDLVGDNDEMEIGRAHV